MGSLTDLKKWGDGEFGEVNYAFLIPSLRVLLAHSRTHKQSNRKRDYSSTFSRFYY